ncbi:hypothetical protein [Natronospora cellulosivora (SeqCode)]
MDNNTSGLLKFLQFIMDRNVKTNKKLLFLLPILYLFSPITLIPYKLFPFAGFLENIIMFFIIIYFLKRMLASYDPYTSHSKKKKKNDKTIVDLKNNDYEIK